MRKASLFCLLLLSALFTAFARGESFKADPVMGEMQPPGWDADELWDGYALGILYGTGSMSTFGTACRDSLTDMEKTAYDLLKAQIALVACGEGTSTCFSISLNELGVKTTWTQDDLSSDIYNPETGSFDKDAFADMLEETYSSQCDMAVVLSALNYDEPYIFYWQDMFKGFNYTQIWWTGFGYSTGYRTITLKMNNDLSFRFPLDTAYQNGDSFTVNTSKTSAAAVSVQNAQNILDEAESMTDVERLTYYMQSIRELSEYDSDAAQGYNTDSEPWKLISVFDGNPDTKVVCAGYSKAFQYLCDLTDFDTDIEVYCVSGLLDGGAHMWNTVSFSGYNYIADITNCFRSGSTETSLFLSVPFSGNVTDGYKLKRAASGYSAQLLTYIYDTETFSLYSAKQLTLSFIPYADLSSDLSLLNSLVLPESLTVIEAEAFMNCAAQVIYIPASCTQIGSGAFSGCDKLLYIVLPEGSDITITAEILGDRNVTIVYQ